MSLKSVPIFLFLIVIGLAPLRTTHAKETLTVASKNFTESFVLAEMLAQLIEVESALKVERRPGLGGTKICFESLRRGEVDLYPEYTGTGTLVILKDPDFPTDDIKGLARRFEKEFDLTWLDGFGFDNSYALTMRRMAAEKWKVKSYSDLARVRDLRAAFSYEFLNREDGYPALAKHYGFQFAEVAGIQHELAYQAIQQDKIDLTDAYATDGELLKYDMTVLHDDKNFFPRYMAAPLVRVETLSKHPELRKILSRFSGRIDDRMMQRLNLEASRAGADYPAVVAQFLVREKLVKRTKANARKVDLWALGWRHIQLTAISVLLASLVGIPLGVILRRRKRASAVALGVCGVLQTVPSIAMLGFMIPLFGIGVTPAIVALFLYGLLPIVRNTLLGVQNIPRTLLEVARGQGLTYGQILWHVELPLAMKTILAGIRTSAVINIGTATLAAFIGAGGLGEPIVTGIALHDTGLILSGAVPAALLALIADGGLSLVERHLLPEGFRVGIAH